MSDNFETLENFIARNRITMTCERADGNPNFDGASGMHHWRVVLRLRSKTGTRSLSTYFSMGAGHNGAAPELDEVLNCLALDAGGVESANGFDDWAAEYGYSSDSRKAERTFRVCQRHAKRLRAFLGETEYSKILSHEVECL